MKKLPKFLRQNYAQIKRVRQTGWRKPRGIDNKLRISLRSAGFLPKIGFRTSIAERGLHPTGLKEFLVSNEKQLRALSGSKAKIAIRISGTAGGRLREIIMQSAEKMGFKVLNPAKKKKEAEKTKVAAEKTAVTAGKPAVAAEKTAVAAEKTKVEVKK